jgi:hypothetical protein
MVISIFLLHNVATLGLFLLFPQKAFVSVALVFSGLPGWENSPKTKTLKHAIFAT